MKQMINDADNIQDQRHQVPHQSLTGLKLEKLTPLPCPIINRQLGKLPALERSGEVIRYTILKMEYWISPGGLLRGWLRFNLCAALLLGIPSAFIVPVVTLLLSSAATWAALLAELTGNLLLAMKGLGNALLWLGGIYLVIRLIEKPKQ